MREQIAERRAAASTAAGTACGVLAVVSGDGAAAALRGARRDRRRRRPDDEPLDRRAARRHPLGRRRGRPGAAELAERRPRRRARRRALRPRRARRSTAPPSRPASRSLVELDPTAGVERQRGDGSPRRWPRSRSGAVAPAARDDAEGRFVRGDAVGFVDGEIVAWGGAGSTLAATIERARRGCRDRHDPRGRAAPRSRSSEVAALAPDGRRGRGPRGRPAALLVAAGGAVSPAKPSWGDAIAGRHPVGPRPEPVAVGALEGEGVGPEVVAAALDVLAAACESDGRRPRRAARARSAAGVAAGLSEDAAEFCRDTFARGGAVLHRSPRRAAGSTSCRQRFDLFCKVSPLVPDRRSAPLGRFEPEPGAAAVDILVVREQAAGDLPGAVERDGPPARGPRRRARLLLLEQGGAPDRRGGGAARRRAQRPARRSSSSAPGSPRSAGSGRRSPARSRPAPESSCEVLDIDYAVYAMLREPGGLRRRRRPEPLRRRPRRRRRPAARLARALLRGQLRRRGRRRLPDQPWRRPRPRGHRHAPTPALRSWRRRRCCGRASGWGRAADGDRARAGGRRGRRATDPRPGRRGRADRRDP